MWKEFKDFALRGNVLDLAVGVIIGGAFNKIVSSLVENILTPILGVILGKVNLSSISLFPFGVEVKLGMFLQSIIDFVIIAFTIFIMVKVINNFRRKEDKEESKEEAEVKFTKEEELLMEIRDILKSGKDE